MKEADDRLTQLEQQMAQVVRRLEGMELRTATPGVVETVAEEPGTEGNLRGTLAYTGFVQAGELRFKIQAREELSKILEAEPEPAARAFAALGSPFRILLLRALLQGPRTSQELQAELNVGAVGQLYHHLKELLAAGLIVQRKRSVYAIREEKVLPVCMFLVTALRLVKDQEPLRQSAKTDQTDQTAGPDQISS